jgi:hypothetical protein
VAQVPVRPPIVVPSSSLAVRCSQYRSIAVDKIQKVDRNDCVYIGKEIIHIPDGYLQTFRQFLETRSIEKR